MPETATKQPALSSHSSMNSEPEEISTTFYRLWNPSRQPSLTCRPAGFSWTPTPYGSIGSRSVPTSMMLTIRSSRPTPPVNSDILLASPLTALVHRSGWVSFYSPPLDSSPERKRILAQIALTRRAFTEYYEDSVKRIRRIDLLSKLSSIEAASKLFSRGT